ncbi:MAG: RNA-directed DNA polymerase [Bacteroides sp.]|nr:RNA-directed DNA polymerase [Bacteroides sp.]
MTFEEIMEAYMQCRKNKRYTREVLAFEVDCEQKLQQLYDELSSGSYQIGPSKVFIVEYPVRREVFAASFRDRILHHWLHMKLNPLFEREFIYDTYGCRTGKGTLFGIRRVKRFIASCSRSYTQDCYILRCDIRGFFMNIDRNILAGKLDAFIRSRYKGEDIEEVRRLTRQVVMVNPVEGCQVNSVRTKWDGLPRDKSIFTTNGYAMPNGFPSLFDEVNRQKGIPIGNLTSQLFANFYLNGLDHFVKHTLGLGYYGRYMDDFVMVHPDKEFLLKVKKDVRNSLNRSYFWNCIPTRYICNIIRKE